MVMTGQHKPVRLYRYWYSGRMTHLPNSIRRINMNVIKRLYNKIKKDVRFNKTHCFNDCKFAHRKFYFCKLFDEVTLEGKRCKDCMEVFGK